MCVYVYMCVYLEFCLSISYDNKLFISIGVYVLVDLSLTDFTD